MAKIFHIYENGDWVLESLHATGSDFGPGGYIGKEPIDSWLAKQFAERRNVNLEFFTAQGAIVKDHRRVA